MVVGDEESKEAGLREHKSRLIKAGRMYAMCQKAEIADPLQLVSLALAAFEDMPLGEALAFLRMERTNLEDLAWAFARSSSPEEFEQRLREAKGREGRGKTS